MYVEYLEQWLAHTRHIISICQDDDDENQQESVGFAPKPVYPSFTCYCNYKIIVR